MQEPGCSDFLTRDSTFANRPRYIARMSSLRSRTRATTNTRVRSWGVTLIRKRGQFLGWVDAPDAKAAELAAVRAFNLSEEKRKRLLVRERV
jgi:hypothetical protein